MTPDDLIAELLRHVDDVAFFGVTDDKRREVADEVLELLDLERETLAALLRRLREGER